MENKYPKLREDLIISRQVQGGETVYIIKDPRTSRFFRLREPEYFLAHSLDGQSGLAEILKKYGEHFSVQISPEQYSAFIAALEKKDFLETGRSEYVTAHALTGEPRKSFMARLLYVKLKAFDPTRFLEWLYEKFKFMLTGPWFFFMLVIIAAGFLQALALSSDLPKSIYQVFGLWSFPLALVAIFFVVALHELAHALVCRHYGGEVHEMGFLLMYFQVCFYCNLSDSYLFEKKHQRVLTMLAGLIMQAFLGAAGILMWRVLKTDSFISNFLFLTASVAFLTMLFNLNPLLKLDGYYLLAELVEIPNLRSKAFGYLRSLFRNVFYGPEPSRQQHSGREKRIFFLYAILALIYSLLLFGWIGLIIYGLLVGTLGGIGFLLFLALIIVIFNQPLNHLLGSIGKVFRGQGVSMPRSLRFYFWTIVLGGLIALAVFYPVDLKINAPLSLEPLEKFIIKGGGDSQLETNWFKGGSDQQPINRVYQFSISDFAVLDIQTTLTIGTPVDSGQILLEISSNHFRNQLNQTLAEIEHAQAEYQLLLSDPKAAELARAKAALEEEKLRQINVEQEYQRAKKMHEKQLISEVDWEAASTARYIQNKKVDFSQSEFDLLKAGPKAEELLKQDAEIRGLQTKADYLREQIAACTIRAPFTGELTLLGVEGELITLARTDSMEVNIHVPEDQIDILKAGQSLKFRVAGYPQQSFQTDIKKIISVTHSQNNKNHFVAIGTIANPEHRLKGGMEGYGKIYCGRSSVAGNAIRKFVRFFRVEFWSWW